MLANLLDIAIGGLIGLGIVALIIRGEEIVGMLLHVLQYLFAALTCVTAALTLALTTLYGVLTYNQHKRAKRLRQQSDSEAQVHRLESTLKTWQPFTVDLNAAMSNALLNETLANARPLAIPRDWDVRFVQLPRVLTIDEAQHLTDSDWERLRAVSKRINEIRSTPPKGSDSIYHARPGVQPDDYREGRR